MLTIDPTAFLIDRFKPLLYDVLADDGHREYWLKGGRGSTKSSAISVILILLLIAFPFVNVVVFRRYKNSLRDTVYEQMVWAINKYHLQDRFTYTVSPMEITYRTGQKVMFVGVDDPGKTKGAVFRVGYGAVLLFEELDEFPSWEFVSRVIRTYRRGGDRFWTFYTYNPPKNMVSWVNRQALEMARKPDCLVDHSTYLDVVESGHADWLGEEFLLDAEYERETHPRQYEWEFLGEVTGTGGAVFDNLVDREIPDDEIEGYENTRNGVDWGWFPDPWVFIRCEWQREDRRLIVYEEHSRNKTLPSDTARIVRESMTREVDGTERYMPETVWCDDDPTSVNEYRRAGVKAHPARKGGMRRPSYQWLAGLREIVIDPRRCPLAWEEFRLCEFAKDRAGEWIDDFPDGNDHAIDAVRYAMMNDVVRGR